MAEIWNSWSSLLCLITKSIWSSLFWHLLTNLTIYTIPAGSQRHLKKCVNLWCSKTVLLVDKVNLIVSIFYHLLTNLTTSTIATCSLSPLKKCLNLWCFNTVTCIWFHCGNMKYETVYKVYCVWIMNKVDLIEYQLLTNLTTTCSQL